MFCPQVDDAVKQYRSKENVRPVPAAQQELHSLKARAATPLCKEFIEQLEFELRMLIPVKGQAYITRKVVKLIFDHWGRHVFPTMFLRQQLLVRKLDSIGSRLSVDHTYRLASSLGAADPKALTAHGKAKMTPLRASLLTCIGAYGLPLFSVLVPNDGQDHVVTAVSALWGADTDASEGREYHQAIRKHIMVGGELGTLADFIATDFCAQQTNLWRAMAHNVVQACCENEVTVMIPCGGSRQSEFALANSASHAPVAHLLPHLTVLSCEMACMLHALSDGSHIALFCLQIPPHFQNI